MHIIEREKIYGGGLRKVNAWRENVFGDRRKEVKHELTSEVHIDKCHNRKTITNIASLHTEYG